MKKSIIALAALAAVITFASCNDDSLNNNDEGIRFTKGAVAFRLNTGIDGTTRAEQSVAETKGATLIIDEEERLALVETITRLDDLTFAEPAVTRGTPVYTENLTVFTVGAIAPTGTTTALQTMQSYSYLNSEKYWYYDYVDALDWSQYSGGLMFYFQVPAEKPATITSGPTFAGGKITFDYTSPSGTTADAEAQQEILFSCKELTKDKARTPSDNTVLLYHTLTGVKFRAGNDGVGTITKVQFTGLNNSGSCTVTPNYESNINTSPGNPSNKNGAAATKSAACSVWSGQSGSATFTQTFSGTTVDYTSGEGNPFGDSWYAAANTDNLNTVLATQTFWFIPQAITPDVKLTVWYTYKGQDKSVQLDFGTKVGNIQWLAGELRTYSLTITEAGVTITDEVTTGNVKQNIVITNTGTHDEYVRVAVIANWVNTAGDIVAPCTPILSLNAGWTKNNNDGYLYYANPVAPGAQPATAPFTSYTPPAHEIAGADHLVMDLAVQAIVKGTHDTYTEAWTAAAGVVF